MRTTGVTSFSNERMEELIAARALLGLEFRRVAR